MTLNGVELRKSVAATDGQMVRVSPRRLRGGIWTRLLHPLESALPAGSLAAAVTVDYPSRQLRLGSHRVNWLVALFALSLLFGLLLKRPMRVEL